MRLFFATIVIVLSSAVFGGAAPSHDDIAGKADLVVDDASTLRQTIVTAYLQQKHEAGKNILWCNTFQLCWNELMEFAKGPLELQGNPPTATFLNKRQGSREDLDDPSYLSLIGQGPKTIERIKNELRKKFNGAARPAMIPKGLGENQFLAYAYLFKCLPFRFPFAVQGQALTFSGVKVKSFGVWEGLSTRAKLADQVAVLDYVSNEDFVIELLSVEKSDRIIIARMKPGETLEKSVEHAMKRAKASHVGRLSEVDRVEVPKLNFDIMKSYPELTDKLFLNKTVSFGTALVVAEQSIRFRLDEKGAVLKSEARSVGEESLGDDKPRRFVCDGPFLILMLRKDAKLPYFALWVENAELLVRSDHSAPSSSQEKSAGPVDPFE